MKQSFFYRFLVRWFVSSLGLWIAASILSSVDVAGGWVTYLLAGLILAAVNAVLRPILVFFSLPAILVTLGLFMIIINGFTVLIVSWLYTPLQVTNFWAAMLAGVIIGLVNYLVTTILESRDS